MTTIEFKTEFKERIKDYFLTQTKFLNNSLLLFEHFDRPEYKKFLPKIEELFYEKFPKLLEEITEAHDNFFYEFFFKAEDIEDLPTLALMKTSYNKEKRLINAQLEKLMETDYNDKLNDNKSFNSKINDFVRIIKPDGEFSLEIKNKELAFLNEEVTQNENQLDKTVDSIVYGVDPTEITIGQDGGFDVGGDDGFGYSGSNKAFVIFIF